MHEQTDRVLLVDDNTEIHEDFRKVLAAGRDTQELDALAALMTGQTRPNTSPSACPRIDSAYQGKDALKLVEHAMHEARPYSLAFVDMRMPPGWDGVETIERLWKADPELQVIICSAYSDYLWEEIVERLGHPDRLMILHKPFDAVEVRQLCSALIAKWRLLRDMRERMVELEELAARLQEEINARSSRRDRGEASD